MSATEYKLTTLNDVFIKVPADRIPTCLSELGKLMETTKAYAELIHAVAVDLAKKDGKVIPEFDAAGYAFTLPMTWKDDGKETLQTNFTIGGKPFTSIEIKKES